MRGRSVLGLALGALAGAGACGGMTENSGSRGGIAIDDLAREIAAAQCALYERCLGVLLQFDANGEDCRTLTQKRLENRTWVHLKAAVLAGQVEYDGERMQQCVDEIRAQACDELTHRSIESCVAAVKGDTAVGEDCVHGFECERDAFCKLADGCPGKCTDRQAAGASCTNPDHCRNGLICSPDQLCVKPAVNGEACEGGSAPPCAPASICMGATDQAPGTCRSVEQVFVGTSGAPCGSGIESLCTGDWVCVTETTQTQGTCQARASSGGVCNRTTIPAHCPIGEYCAGDGDTGTCKALPDPGEPCAEVANGSRCAAYSRCVNGACEALAVNGSTCTANASCFSGDCVSGTCRANACAK